MILTNDYDRIENIPNVEFGLRLNSAVRISDIVGRSSGVSFVLR